MKIGFIGAGNMAGAIICGILNSGYMSAEDICISRKHPELGGHFAGQNVQVMQSDSELVKSVDCVVLAIKPVVAGDVLKEIYDCLDSKFVISIMAGWTYDMLKNAMPESARFVRVMPNTPLAVGEGMSVISTHANCTEEEFALAKQIFSLAGKVVAVDDHVYTPANGVSGCGPAFVYEFIEAMADGGVRYGIPRALSYKLAAQTMIGAAKMVLETEEHPGKLKDAVCSPGGTTIEGCYQLEKGGMRAAVMDAIGAAIEKTYRMAK